MYDKITGKRKIEKEYQMTQYDDVLDIIDAEVTLVIPGDIFTNEGDDVVTVINSTLTGPAGTSLFLGSGDDSLEIAASTLSLAAVTGVGKDYVLISFDGDTPGSVTITEGNALYLCSRDPEDGTDGDDTLELVSTLEGAGDIFFGDGVDTLSFNGGKLMLTGEISGLETISVSAAGGTLGRDLVLTEAATSIVYAGGLAGTDAAKVITLSGSDTTFATDGEVTTDVAFSVIDGTFVSEEGSAFTISRHAGTAFTAENATVMLRDIDFSGNDVNGITATDTLLAIEGGSFVGNKKKGMLLSGTALLASDLKFTGNNGAIKTDGALAIDNVEFTGNFAASGKYGGAIETDGNVVLLANAVFDGNYATGGGAIYATQASVTVDGGVFKDNRSISPYYYGGAIWADNATVDLTDVEFSGNFAKGVGGAIYLGKGSTLTYTLTAYQATDADAADDDSLRGESDTADELHRINIAGNYSFNKQKDAQSAGAGGFLYLATKNDAAIFDIEEKAELTIGDATGNDSIDGLGSITKNGVGDMVIDSEIGFDLTWTVAGGTLTLRRIARNIDLANFTVDSGATLVLSNQTDVLSMNADVVIGGTIDLGGGSERIDTNGCSLTGGDLLITTLVLTGDGVVASDLTIREGATALDLTLDGITLESDVTGGDTADSISIVQASALGGDIELGDGNDKITIQALDGAPATDGVFADFAGEVDTGWGDDVITIADETVFRSDLYMCGRTVTIDGDVVYYGLVPGLVRDALELEVTDNNTLTVNAETTFRGDVWLGVDDDKISIAAATVFEGGVALRDGNNEITASATVEMQQGVSAAFGTDLVTFDADAVIDGAIDLGGGYNLITVNGTEDDRHTLTLGDAAYVQLTEGGSTTINISRYAGLAENVITACFDATSPDALVRVDYDWTDYADLDKVRLVVSSDGDFSDFEFAVELYNGSKTFTIFTDETNHIQLQAQDEDGWKPRFTYPDKPRNDLNADGRADVILSITEAGHACEGATGAWLIQAEQTAAWADLSQRDEGWEIFGTGFTSMDKKSADVYLKSTDNVVGAWTMDGDGQVTGWKDIETFDADTRVLGLGDFNGNGQSDLLLRNVNGAVGCYFTAGKVTGWNYFQSIGAEWRISAIGDLNGDGFADVVLRHDAGFAGSWLTRADGTIFWADLDTLSEDFAIVGTGDFNGDGTDDVLLQKDDYFGAWIVQNGNVSAWMGLGTFDGTVEQIADFDGDGIDDLRIRTEAGDLGVQLVKGEDTLEWKYYGSLGNEWSTSMASI